MEIVVLNSDIARLVLGKFPKKSLKITKNLVIIKKTCFSYTDYLKSQKLKKATHTFCKTSPYLKQEFAAYKHGLQTHSFFPELQEIICEYVKISRKGKIILEVIRKRYSFL